MFTVEDGKVYQYIMTGQSTIRAAVGNEVATTETDTEVIIQEFDRQKGQYVERERFAKVADDPDTSENEEQSFWTNVYNRIAFWRSKE